MIATELNEFELYYCAELAITRFLEALRKGLADKHGANCEDGLWYHFWGACGEMAWAKATGVYFLATVNTFKQPDVGNIFVRCRTYHTDDLNIRKSDPEGTYGLVTVNPKEYPFQFHACGTFERCNVRDEHVKNYAGREAAWFVPQSELRPLIRPIPRGVR